MASGPVVLSGGFSPPPTSLKNKQREAVLKLLNFNVTGEEGGRVGLVGDWSDQWKVLVYDKACRDVISTLLNVTQLRKQGVTLHMLLEAEREAIPDVPAVYFCQPTAENVRRIAADAGKRLYSNLHLNFSSKLERPLMELLAREVLATSSVDMISKIYDQHLDFVSLEHRLFSLNRVGSYCLYNDPTLPDVQVKGAMQSFANGLFGALATLGGVPIIRAPKGGPAQMVAEHLNKLVSDHLMGAGTAFNAGPGGGYQRPLLVIMDRSMDLITALRHNSTYQALLDDVVDHRVNRVTVELEGREGTAKRKKTYDVDAENDYFYRCFKGSPFPEAIEANGSELAAVTQKEEDIRRRTSAAGINVDVASAGGGAAGGLGAISPEGGTQELAAAVESLPKLLEQKKGLEMHTNILKAIMDVVASREVPVYFEAEEEMVSTSIKNKARVKDLLSSTKGSVEDKLRLLGVYILAARPTAAEVTELEAILRETALGERGQNTGEVERGLAAIGYLRQQVSLQHLPTVQVGGVSGEAPRSGPNKIFQGLLAKATTKATGLLAKAAATAEQLLSRANNTYVTRVVESLLEHGEEDETYLYWDPKLRERADPAAARARGPPRDVIVFMIGGGCYSEYQNLQAIYSSFLEFQDFAQRRSQNLPLSLTYGSTEIVNAEAFLRQLMEVGTKSQGK
ncbi:unnamed protein product [Discosporangium mesarthrocarpum]